MMSFRCKVVSVDATLESGGHAYLLLPAALREAQTCRYLVYSEANFEVFRPAGATRCTGACPLRDLHKICRVCTSFQDALGVKIWLDLLKGLRSYGGFKLRVSGFPQIFSAP